MIFNKSISEIEKEIEKLEYTRRLEGYDEVNLSEAILTALKEKSKQVQDILNEFFKDEQVNISQRQILEELKTQLEKI